MQMMVVLMTLTVLMTHMVTKTAMLQRPQQMASKENQEIPSLLKQHMTHQDGKRPLVHMEEASQPTVQPLDMAKQLRHMAR